MKDCKKHYAEMYETRLGESGCPWCELESIKTTIKTFLHDLDDVPADDKPGVLMSSFMWMQVEAFRKIVSR